MQGELRDGSRGLSEELDQQQGEEGGEWDCSVLQFFEIRVLDLQEATAQDH